MSDLRFRIHALQELDGLDCVPNNCSDVSLRMTSLNLMDDSEMNARRIIRTRWIGVPSAFSWLFLRAVCSSRMVSDETCRRGYSRKHTRCLNDPRFVQVRSSTNRYPLLPARRHMFPEEPICGRRDSCRTSNISFREHSDISEVGLWSRRAIRVERHVKVQ